MVFKHLHPFCCKTPARGGIVCGTKNRKGPDIICKVHANLKFARAEMESFAKKGLVQASMPPVAEIHEYI